MAPAGLCSEELLAKRVVEFRIFRIHPGQRENFAARFCDSLLSLQQRHGIQVICWGPSLHDRDSYLVVRVHPSVEARQQSLDAMFGSAEWLMEEEEEVLEMIESYNTCVVEADEQLIEAIRADLIPASIQDVTPPG